MNRGKFPRRSPPPQPVACAFECPRTFRLFLKPWSDHGKRNYINFGDVVSEMDTPYPRIDVKQVKQAHSRFAVWALKRGVSLSPQFDPPFCRHQKKTNPVFYHSFLPHSKTHAVRYCSAGVGLTYWPSCGAGRMETCSPQLCEEAWQSWEWMGDLLHRRGLLSPVTGRQAPVTGTGHRLITCTQAVLTQWTERIVCLTITQAAAAAAAGFANTFASLHLKEKHD